MKIKMTLLAVLAAISLTAGCTTHSSVKASPLSPTIGQNVNLRKYQIATVVPFIHTGKSTDSKAGERFAANLERRIRKDFGPLFNEVRTNAPTGQPDELIITGRIKQYEPGSREARAMLIGLGAAHFKADLVLRDGATQEELLVAPISKLWAWGGIMGAAKGIEEMTEESAASAAKTIAIHKGWGNKLPVTITPAQPSFAHSK